MSRSETPTSPRPSVRTDSVRITAPATIVGARSGWRPSTRRRSSTVRLASIAAMRSQAARLRRWPCTASAPSIAASEVAVPATAIPCCGSTRGTVLLTSSASDSSSSSVGGSLFRKRSVCRTEPIWVDSWNSGRSPGRPTTYSVEPPPMSMTTVSRSSARPAVAPTKVRRASSSPEIVRASTPYVSRRWSRNAAPFSASRMALVATATMRSAPSRSITRRYSAIAAATRPIASSASRPVRSTPWPRVVMVVRLSSSTTPPSASRSATSRRVVFVPMSMTATGTSVEQLEHALDRPSQDRALAADHHGPLQELSVLGHEADRLVVVRLPLTEPELRVHRLALAEERPRRPAGLPDELPDLVLGERLDVIVDPVEVDAPLLEQRREVPAGRASPLLVHHELRHAVDATERLHYPDTSAAGWSSQVARRAHNPKVAGSNPAPATRKPASRQAGFRLFGQPVCATPLPRLGRGPDLVAADRVAHLFVALKPRADRPDDGRHRGGEPGGGEVVADACGMSEVGRHEPLGNHERHRSQNGGVEHEVAEEQSEQQRKRGSRVGPLRKRAIVRLRRLLPERVGDHEPDPETADGQQRDEQQAGRRELVCDPPSI